MAKVYGFNISGDVVSLELDSFVGGDGKPVPSATVKVHDAALFAYHELRVFGAGVETLTKVLGSEYRGKNVTIPVRLDNGKVKVAGAVVVNAG